MKVFLLFCLIGMLSFSAKAQQQPKSVVFNFYKESSISLAYLNSFGEIHSRNFHLMDVRYERSKYGGMHPFFINWSAGIIVPANSPTMKIAPVIGSRLSFGGIVAGTDLFLATDFNQSGLRLAPVLGFGFHQFQIALQPHVRITNASYEPINRGHLSVNFKILSLRRQIIN